MSISISPSYYGSTIDLLEKAQRMAVLYLKKSFNSILYSKLIKINWNKQFQLLFRIDYHYGQIYDKKLALNNFRNEFISKFLIEITLFDFDNFMVQISRLIVRIRVWKRFYFCHEICETSEEFIKYRCGLFLNTHIFKTKKSNSIV